jgi:hypothetical protein
MQIGGDQYCHQRNQIPHFVRYFSPSNNQLFIRNQWLKTDTIENENL